MDNITETNSTQPANDFDAGDYYYAAFSDDYCEQDDVAHVGSIAVPVFFSIVVVLSLIGNILVLVILGLYETLKSLTNIFILNLALSDLLFTLGLPFWASYYMWGWTMGEGVCRGVNFVFSAGFFSSILFLMAMTIQRYLAVVHPLSDWERGQKFAVVAVLVWVLSFTAALPAGLYSALIPHNDKLYCEYNSTYVAVIVTYEQNTFFIFAFLVMAFCYVQILRTIMKSRTSKRHKTIKLVFTIVAVFFFGWGPYNLVIFLQTLIYYQIDVFLNCTFDRNLNYVEYVTKLLAYSHCCLNPLFYVFVGVKFRNHLKRILEKIFQRQCQPDPLPVRTVQSQGSMYGHWDACRGTYGDGCAFVKHYVHILNNVK